MRKNLPLYILLIFLIIMNGFFLYNYLGNGEKKALEERKGPGDFLVKELGFDEFQEETFREIGQEHHQRMQVLSENIRGLKDELFKGLSDASLQDVNIDSIARLIGDKEAAKDLEVFRHFKQVQGLCTEKQIEKFSKIIQDALKKGSRDQGPPGEGRPNGNRPPRPDGPPNGSRPPHLDGPEGDRPPPPEH